MYRPLIAAPAPDMGDRFSICVHLEVMTTPAVRKQWREDGRCHDCGAPALPDRSRCGRCQRKRSWNPAGAGELESLLIAQRGCCRLCGIRLRLPGNAELGHILPQPRGRVIKPDNLVWLCEVCVELKGDHGIGEFLEHVQRIYGHCVRGLE
jgi:5-methylcytosine-specific restriction endonuclease McrA